MEIKKAIRKSTKIKIAITGPSGSGKTLSALRLAHGLGKSVCIVDTENESASLYADKFPGLDCIHIGPPYSLEKYLEAIRLMSKGNYDVGIIDSLSHAWAGEGGLLQVKEQLDQRGGNSYTNWAKLTPMQEKLISSILHAPLHLICTMRSKQDYAMITNEKGKTEVKKMGLAPVQRDGIEYEFTTVFDVAMNHDAAVSKDRTGVFADKIFLITEETGLTIKNWLDVAVKTAPVNVDFNKSITEKLIPIEHEARSELLKKLASSIGRETLNGKDILLLDITQAEIVDKALGVYLSETSKTKN